MRVRKFGFKKNIVCGLVIFTLCVLPVLSGCTSKEKTSDVQEGTGAKNGQESPGDESSNSGGQEAGTENESLGDFTMQDINGEIYTQEMFVDHELTMVNVFTTWCTPCIREIPDLMELQKEMADQGVQIVGIVLDAAGRQGKTDQEAVEKAKLLAEETEAVYPFLIPDESLLNGRLAGISAVPETFFVDKEGNITGETYSGSRSFEDWKSIVEKELEGAVQ